MLLLFFHFSSAFNTKPRRLKIINHLAAKFFCYPPISMEIILYIPGSEIFFTYQAQRFVFHVYCLAWTFFFGTRVLLST